MKLLHTADLHLGQILYQSYDRSDEHRHYFRQLKKWCREYRPDALIVSGDIFDIQQPSAATRKAFNDFFVELHLACPEMAIVITAGNHDSASRVQADRAIWAVAGTTLVGTAPPIWPADGWEEKYIVRIPSGYIIPMPYMGSGRKDTLQQLLDYVAAENSDGRPVVMTGHTAVTGLDPEGHNFEIGSLRTQDVSQFGNGYDYLALGHIHKPQTIGHLEDALRQSACYPSPVIRYCGSALHVSCDECYPHTVSLVEIDRHRGNVSIEQLRIDELRHFYVLPQDNTAFENADDAIRAIESFCKEKGTGYIRLRIDIKADLPSDFNQRIYEILSGTGDEVRYNPKIIWTGDAYSPAGKQKKPVFEVAELQQMTDPVNFIEKTIAQYPNLSLDEVREAFKEVEKEIKRMTEETMSRQGQSPDNTRARK